MELRAVVEYLHAIGEVVATPGVRRATRAPPDASSQPLRGLESRELSVVRVDRPVERRFAGEAGAGGSAAGPASTTAGSSCSIWRRSRRSPP